MSYRHGKFVWFEHLSQDVERARAFYGALFGWETDRVSMGEGSYHMIRLGEEGIGGFRVAPAGARAHWISYLSVADVDAAAGGARAAGGEIRMPPTDFPPVGRGARLADPAGAEFCVWHDARGDREDRDPVPPGDWYWNENMSGDSERSLAFYREVFGFEDATTPGAKGSYHLLCRDGIARAGLMALPGPGLASAWIGYVSVADCDASIARALELGAVLHVGPMQVDAGRFAVLGDTLGAKFGVMHGTHSG